MTEPNLSVRQRKTFTKAERCKLAAFRHLLDLARVYPQQIPPDLAALLLERAERARQPRGRKPLPFVLQPHDAALWRDSNPGSSPMILTAGARRALPPQDFAGPGRSYPVENPTHAKLAKAMTSRAVNAARMSRSEEGRIDAKANRHLDNRSAG